LFYNLIRNAYLCRMIFRKLTYIIALSIILFSAASCSDYQKLLKSDNYELKYEKAIEYYEADEYYKASNLFEELMNIYKGTDRAEKIHYYYAYCLYSQGELSLAAYHFKKFASSYPNSEHKQDAEFRAALCYYDISPKPSLDQTYTERGIDEFQGFLEKYPNTEYRDTINLLVDKLHHKLETKAYENAYLYYKIGEYKAAMTALDVIIDDYPDSPYNQDAMFYIFKSAYLYAEGSVESKMEERFKNSLTAYYRLIDQYPETNYRQEADRLKSKIENSLNN
jgi:outer membrane protein assembly factor BamD